MILPSHLDSVTASDTQFQSNFGSKFQRRDAAPENEHPLPIACASRLDAIGQIPAFRPARGQLQTQGVARGNHIVALATHRPNLARSRATLRIVTMEKIYLDYNASTPIAPEVKAVVCDLLEREIGNPLALRWASTGAREIIEGARSDVADLLGGSADEFVFTSGGSESINHALKGSFFARQSDRRQIITTRTEHPAVLSTCTFLERFGAEITYVPADRTGKLDPNMVRAAISDRTLLVSLSHANGEVGAIQDIGSIAEILRANGVLLHVDAAQSAGKIEIDVDALGADLLSLAGQNMYTPKGVGVLYIKRGISIDPLVHGADHQFGRRAGTESALLAAALGMAS